MLHIQPNDLKEVFSPKFEGYYLKKKKEINEECIRIINPLVYVLTILWDAPSQNVRGEVVIQFYFFSLLVRDYTILST